MKGAAVPTLLFYLVLAACLWPLYLAGLPVVTYLRSGWAAHSLVQMPPIAVLVAAGKTLLLLWAIPAGVVLFRKEQDSHAWLVALLVLAPVIAELALKLGA